MFINCTIMNDLNTSISLESRTLNQAIGFRADEIHPGEPTRQARLKWVIVVNAELAPGRAANAAACVAAVTGSVVSGMLGDAVFDADGSEHAGLPWAGCSVLVASGEKLAAIRAKAETREDMHVADMPVLAQETRVYAEYLERMTERVSSEIAYAAVGLVGERKRVDRLVGGLSLLT